MSLENFKIVPSLVSFPGYTSSFVRRNYRNCSREPREKLCPLSHFNQFLFCPPCLHPCRSISKKEIRNKISKWHSFININFPLYSFSLLKKWEQNTIFCNFVEPCTPLTSSCYSHKLREVSSINLNPSKIVSFSLILRLFRVSKLSSPFPK